MTFDEALEMLYAPNVSGGWGRRELYEDRIKKIRQTIELTENIFVYIKDPFGDTNNPSLILFSPNYLVQVLFIDGKLEISFFHPKQIEQITFEDDMNDNVSLKIKFNNLPTLTFSSDDCNKHWKRKYVQEIYNILKLVQGWHMA